MDDDVEPSAKADMDPNFDARVRDLRDQAGAEAARREGGPVRWQRPSGWGGDLFDAAAASAPFDRSAANDWMVDALDPDAPGVTGDLVSCQTQIETLACMERAWRNRHTTRARAVAHALSRKQGHASPTGALGGNAHEYVAQLNRKSREPG